MQKRVFRRADRAPSKIRDANETLAAWATLTLIVQVFNRVPFSRNMLIAGAGLVGFVIWTQVRRRASWYEQGLRPLEIRTPLWVLGPATIGIAAVVWYIGSALETIHFPMQALGLLLLYPLWAFFQQYLVCAYFAVRAENLLPSRFTLILAAAFLFGTTHLPNLFLTVTTFVAGLLWIWTFLVWRNLYVTALSQGFLAVTARCALPVEWTHEFKIGAMMEWPSLAADLDAVFTGMTWGIAP
jgi:hypothetical protein